MSETLHHVRPFNSPLECGFRQLFVLNAAEGEAFDLQRLVSFDYLLVHSGDVPDGPRSLHPAAPFRGGELLVKRELLQVGLNQMFARELLAKTFDASGIAYHATELTGAFLDLMSTPYAYSLRERSHWLVSHFRQFSHRELERYMTERIGRWGAEFDRLTAINELEL